MKALRMVTAGLASCFAVVFGLAIGSGDAAGVGRGRAPLSVSEFAGSPLVLPGARFLLGEQQINAQREADRFSPAAATAREASRMRYERLSPSQAAGLARRAFPGVVAHTEGDPAQAIPGARVTGYPTDTSARLLLPGGKRAVVESAAPLAIADTHGRRIPISLSPRAVKGGFTPATDNLDVRIPSSLAEGVSLPALGVTLTPLRDQAGRRGGGRIDGSGVFYPEASRNTDAFVKATISGFEEDTLLRSVDSPRQLSFRVGLPRGARLVTEKGGAQVLLGGHPIATIPTPTAHDAEGTEVPVAMHAGRDLLALTVGGAQAEVDAYRYPIDVDPTVIDNVMATETAHNNWTSSTNNPGAFFISKGKIRRQEGGTYNAGDYAYFVYPTQGESHIFALGTHYSWSHEGGAPVEALISIASPGKGGEGEMGLSVSTEGPAALCTEVSCEAKGVNSTNKENRAFFEVRALEQSNIGFSAELTKPEIYIDQEKGPSDKIDTSDATLGGYPNAAVAKWASTASGTQAVLGVNAFDPGTGVDEVGIKSPNKTGWGYAPVEMTENECAGPFKFNGISPNVQCNECHESTCAATGAHGKPLSIPFAELGELPEGEDTVEATVRDAVGLTATASTAIKVDNTKPSNVPLTGLPAEIAAGEYHLKAEATDAKSGIKSIALGIDGREIGSAAGACEPGPCTGKGEWTILARTFAVGTHVATVVATDNAGNVSTEEFTFKVNQPDRVNIGPGMVNLASGEFSYSTTDVSMGGLTVGRTYASRHLNNGGGFLHIPFGKSWALTLGNHQTLEMQPNGSMILASAGAEVIFAKKGETYESPSGDTSLKLVFQEKSGVQEYVLKDEATATSTTFTQPSKSGSTWVPTIQQGPVPTDTVTYSYETSGEGVGVAPAEELAPVPAGVSCSPELKPGCRALKFIYGKLHIPGGPGEKESEWGEAWLHLKEVVYWAYNPVTKEMQKTPVAQYVYDEQGRLRAEWDPRVSPALETKYGYGPGTGSALTAITPPGQESWAFTYGAIATDSSEGRLLKATLAPASAPLWSGSAPVNTEAPKITGAMELEKRLSVTTGVWSGSPVVYGYQWERCNSAGQECVAILGATTANYKVTSSDLGRTLIPKVTATNGGGSVTVSGSYNGDNLTEGIARSPEPGYSVQYAVPLSGAGLPTMTSTKVAEWGQVNDVPVEATAVFPADKPRGGPTQNYTGATVYYLDAKGNLVNVNKNTGPIPLGGVSTTEYNATNDVVRTLSADNRQAALKEGGKSVEVAKLLDSQMTYNSEGTEIMSSLGPRHLVKLGNGKEVQARAHTFYSYNEGAPAEGGPYRLVTKVTQGAQVEGESEQDVRTTVKSYSGQNNLGWRLRKPTSVTADPSGLKITHTMTYNEATGELLESTTPLGAAEHAPPSPALQFGNEGAELTRLKEPTGMAIEAGGSKLVADSNDNRVGRYGFTGGWSGSFGTFGSGNGQFNDPKGVAIDSSGNVWVLDSGNNRIEEFNSKFEYVRQAGTSGTGQLSEPEGIAIDSHNNVWVADSKNNRIVEFSKLGEYMKVVGEKGSGNGQLSEPRGVVVDGSGNVWVADTNNNRVEEFAKTGGYAAKFGTAGAGNGQLKLPQGIALDAKGNVWVTDTGNNRVEEFSGTGSYLTQFGTSGGGTGQMSEPRGITVDSGGTAWVVDTKNNRVQKWVSNAGGPHTEQVIYYSAAANESNPECGGRPEWANMPCRIQPAWQPESTSFPTSLPSLPVTGYTYNVWGEPEKVTNYLGYDKREGNYTYDAAGRITAYSLHSTVEGTALPEVSYKYDPKQGFLSEQSTMVEGKAQSLQSAFNTLGELTSYTEANGTISNYEYEKEGDYRLTSVNDGKGTQTYGYDETTGFITSLKDTAASGFALTATYDAEGNMLTEAFPNGMTAGYAYNQTGTPISVEYQKKTHCTEKCVWFKDNMVPTIHGQWAAQTSTQATDKYTYDAVGRLVQTQNEPVGKGCTTRIYTYDEDTNRTSVTTAPPGTGGECTTAGGTVESHAYDQADRLFDVGTSYDPFGDITKLPGADAGGSSLESSFFIDNQLASQTQAGETIGYSLDPANRVRETVSTGKVVSTVVNHYSGPGAEPSWTSELSGNTSRNVPGLDGKLAATQHNTESPVLQMVNLHGDVVATASMSETASAPESTVAEANEYGVPATEAPPKYSWLGGHELPTQLPSGVVTMGARSYVPQLGRFLQVDPVSGGSANAYSYTYGDPVATSDLSGEYTATIDSFDEEWVGGRAEEAAEIRAAENRAAQEEAERETAEAEGEWYSEEEWEEWEEEEEEGEYASYHPNTKEGLGKVSLEGVLTSEPLAEAGKDEGEGDGKNSEVMPPLCEAGSSSPCAVPVARKKKKRRFHKWIPQCPSGTSFDELTHKCELPGRAESREEAAWREFWERARAAGEAQDHGGGLDGDPEGEK